MQGGIKMKILRTKRINGERHIEILINEPENGAAYEQLKETIYKLNRRCAKQGEEKYSYTIVRSETK